MENIFNDSNVNIDEYRPDSPGVIMAKRITKLKKYKLILMLFIVFIILIHLLVKTDNLMLVIIAVTAFIIASSCIIIYETKLQKELEKLPEEEKFNLNYYSLYKNVKKPGWVKNNVLMALAINGALLKNREITRQALELMSANYQPEILYKLKNWLSSDSCEISEAELRRNKSLYPIARIACLIYALSGLLYLYAFIEDYIPIGAYKALALYESIFYSITRAACCVIVINAIYNIINRNKIYVNSPIKNKTKRIILLILGALIFTLIFMTNSFSQYFFGM
ncbi:hypothetical protein [Lachnospira multipara]|uniref:hypothetical protein n=1 Tax=Lachnospira multipara TaxID=28051 RepID=UPI0004E12DFC|nr:hypothetical protein [Lachnospira multipara]